MNISVNGKPMQTDGTLSLRDLLLVKGVDPDQVAVEVNGEIVPRERFAECSITADAKIEIIHFVGGG